MVLRKEERCENFLAREASFNPEPTATASVASVTIIKDEVRVGHCLVGHDMILTQTQSLRADQAVAHGS
jgi:hypothetical protein